MRHFSVAVAFVLFGISLTTSIGCNKGPKSAPIRIDGSSTVFPVTEAVAEEFQKTHKNRVTIGVSGTGGGFKKFCTKGVAIAQASRPIKSAEEKLCAQNHVEYIEMPIAYDGIVVVVHPENNWVTNMTVAELKKIWEPEAQGKITRWNQIRPQWPDKEIHLFSPGVDSGTYDYFTQAIVGKEHSSRGDVTSSEDDNVLVQGVSTDKFSLGFFGFAYYTENKSKLKLVSVDDVAPSFATILEGKYRPLSRPIFIYVSKKESSAPDVKAFVDFYLKEGIPLIREVGYVPLSDQAYELVKKRFEQGIVGSIFSLVDTNKVGKIEQILGGAAHGFGG